MVILGIDPGIAIVGWGVLRFENGKFCPLAYGSVQTKAGLSVEERLRQVHDGVRDIIKKYSPDVMSIEELFWNTNQKTGIIVAEARGVILLAAHEAGIPIFEYTPLQVKQAIVGYGRAEKKQVITMVTAFLGLREAPKPDDTADALALAICHGHCASSGIGQFYNM
ncbi:MAG: crossover junction endodeoxyribonuclease RuvC [Ruminococcaceae bacterium]|nr:crossover junction endodeoxyribonuclease RuvC [Oscillospiraceae bacterium]